MNEEELINKIIKGIQDRYKANGMNQKQLAEASGVSLGALKKLKSSGGMTLGTLIKLYKALGEYERLNQLIIPKTKNADQIFFDDEFDYKITKVVYKPKDDGIRSLKLDSSKHTKFYGGGIISPLKVKEELKKSKGEED